VPQAQIPTDPTPVPPASRSTTTSKIELPKVDEETKDALVKQLAEALLHYILQILK
jgi:endonuclease G